MYIYEMKKEQRQLADKISMLKKELSVLPEGDLICTKNGKYTKWYRSNGSSPIYISKKDRRTAEQLARRKYDLMQLKEASQEKEAIDRYLEEYEKRVEASQKLSEDISRCHSLLAPGSGDISLYKETAYEQLQKWQSEAYEQNPRYPENLIHRTLAGHFVRSKSEVIIANALYQYRIPYRYECALYCDEATLFPDFTIFHPEVCKLYYWEHFGMMDKPSYVDHVCNKLRIYAQQKIIPTVNLITTYETAAYPLDSGKVDSIIREMFL